MKRFRWLAVWMCLALLAGMLSGCGTKVDNAASQEDDGLSVYATFYPLYAITSMLTEGVPDLKLHCLVQPQDGCIRDYQLSDWDLALLSSSANAVIAGGRGLESFESLLYALGEDGPSVSSVLYNMDLSSQTAENMSEDSHWSGENPHIYMKTEGAIAIAERIAANLIVLDPQYKELYAQNLQNAQERLAALGDALRQIAPGLAGKKVIVMNEALIYTAEEYGLEIERCIERESGEAFYDAGLESCLEGLASGEAKVILIEKQAPKVFLDALEGAGYAVARLDVLSTHSASAGSEGYFEAQRANAAAIQAAFSAAGED